MPIIVVSLREPGNGAAAGQGGVIGLSCSACNRVNACFTGRESCFASLHKAWAASQATDHCPVTCAGIATDGVRGLSTIFPLAFNAQVTHPETVAIKLKIVDTPCVQCCKGLHDAAGSAGPERATRDAPSVT